MLSSYLDDIGAVIIISFSKTYFLLIYPPKN